MYEIPLKIMILMNSLVELEHICGDAFDWINASNDRCYQVFVDGYFGCEL